MGLTLVALFGGAYYQFTKSPMLQSMAGQDTAKAQTTPTKAEQATIPQTQAQAQPELTKEQLEQQLKVQEQQFKLELEKQKLEMIMQYEQLHKQFAEQQMQDFYARLELYKSQLPKNYEVIKADPNLQVRAVVKMGNKCNAYNTHGDLMTLSFDECDYYLKASGRVHRNPNAPVARLETTPVADILSENPNAYKQQVDNKISDKPNDLSDKQGG